MWFPILGLLTGLLLGTIFTFAVPVIYAKYLSIAVLAALDSLLGAWHAWLEDKFDSPILVSGFITNMLLAAALAYLGDLLGIDLYLAAVIAFGLRIFSNIGFIRRQIIFRRRQKYRAKKARAANEALNKANNEANNEADYDVNNDTNNETEERKVGNNIIDPDNPPLQIEPEPDKDTPIEDEGSDKANKNGTTV